MMARIKIGGFEDSLREDSEAPVRDSHLGEGYDGMSREVVVHYVEGVEARRSDGQREEALAIVRNANKWSMVAIGIALVALAVAALAFARS